MSVGNTDDEEQVAIRAPMDTATPPIQPVTATLSSLKLNSKNCIII